MKNYSIKKQHTKSRNMVTTVISAALTLLLAFVAFVAWTNLEHEYMWVSASVLTFAALFFLVATISGKAESFLLALIGWW